MSESPPVESVTTPTPRPRVRGVAFTLVIGALGAGLITVGGFGAGAVPYGSGPADALGRPELTFGHGAAAMLAVTWVGIALLVGAWVALAPRAIRGTLSARQALAAAAAWNLPLLPSVPLFSRDAWSYLAQGAMANAGHNPFHVGPAVNPGPVTDQIAGDWHITPTPYGPGHLLIMRGITALTGEHPEAGILLLRLVILAAIGGVAWAVIHLARTTGTPEGPAVWITVASPLTVLHLTGGLHNEVLALLPALLAVLLAFRGRVALAAVAVGVAMAIKITAVIVAPFLLWIVLDRLRRAASDDTNDPDDQRDPDDPAPTPGLLVAFRHTLTIGAIAVGVTAAVSLVGGGFGWIGALDVSDRIVNYLSVPTALAHLAALVTDAVAFNDLLDLARTGASIVLPIVLVAVWWLSRRDASTALRGVVWALLAFVLLNTVSWPWYYPWIAAFWVAARPTTRASVAAVGVTVFLSLVLGPDGSTSLYTWPIMAAVLAATGAAVTAVLLGLRGDAARERSHPEVPAS